MNRVNIAKFKAHLSLYLSRVRKGESVVVTDRKTPIAQVSPYSSSAEQITIPAASASPQIFKKIKIPASPANTDSLQALLEDRADDLESL